MHNTDLIAKGEREARHTVWSSHAARMRQKAATPTQNDITQTALFKDRLAAIRMEATNDQT